MAWVVLFFVAWLPVLILVPARELKRLWPAGLIGLSAAYVIDSTFIGLGAFSYSEAVPGLSGVPVFYLLGVIADSILLAYYYPKSSSKQLLFVVMAALAFLLIETVMNRLNYFHYLAWSPARSYLLDLAGFIVILWLARIVGATGKGP